MPAVDFFLQLFLPIVREKRGSVTILAAAVAPVLLILATAGAQYSFLIEQKTVLQEVADQAALGAAKSLTLATVDFSTVPQTAISIARASLTRNGFTTSDDITATVVDANTGVDVTVRRAMVPVLGSILGASTYSVSARAIAHASGGLPICIIGLDPKRKGTISLDTSAVVQATGCAAYSNSSHPWAIESVANAVLKTGLTCAVGGKHGNFPNFAPQPKSGCPAMHDPLASIPAPTIGPCNYTNFTVAKSGITLQPGVYCGGITINGAYNVLLQSGTYILTNGPFLVGGGASVQGVNVGIYLSGSGAVVNFQANSTINLTAPKTGPLSGLLFFEDRSSPAGQLHQILSNNAQTLLGTIYLSAGRFFVGANAPVSANSAYTIVVADTLELSAGPTLVLNSNYSATDIPVPKGVGPVGGAVHLDY